MNDENPEASGNRWEPTDPPAEQRAEPSGEQAAPPAAAPVAEYAVAEPAPRRGRWLTRARTAVAGGAAAALLAGGLGGFAVGRATAGHDDQVGFDRQGVPSGFHRDGDRDGDGDGRGVPGGPGFAPPGGQVPGSGGADDGQQDDSGTDTQDS